MFRFVRVLIILGMSIAATSVGADEYPQVAEYSLEVIGWIGREKKNEGEQC